jgi:nicotinate-nucleotide adenylyltransferase
MHIALYFGSFNPIHVGHLIIANHVLNHTHCKRLWWVVSPQNPLKPSASLLNEHHRYFMVNLAVEDDVRMQANNIEFSLPKPSYTIDTLTHLSEKYPQHQFSIVMGSDSLSNISKWKNYQRLLADYDILVYRRPGFEPDTALSERITVLEAPLLDISSTQIRQLIKAKQSVRYMLTEPVRQYIEANHYYR